MGLVKGVYFDVVVLSVVQSCVLRRIELMMNNYFRCDQFCIAPSELDIGIISYFCESFEQIPGFAGCAGKPPKMGRPLQGHTHHIRGYTIQARLWYRGPVVIGTLLSTLAGMSWFVVVWMSRLMIHRCSPYSARASVPDQRLGGPLELICRDKRTHSSSISRPIV